MIIAKKILQALLAHASKDTTRPAQCGLFVHFDRRYVVATDGHRCAFLALVPLPVRELEEHMDGGILVPRASIAAALTGAGKELEITPTEIRGGATVAYQPGPEGFPPAFRVIPRKFAKHRAPTIGINAGYLEEALAFVRVASGGTDRVDVSIGEELDPVVVEALDGRALVCIMPMRRD